MICFGYRGHLNILSSERTWESWQSLSLQRLNQSLSLGYASSLFSVNGHRRHASSRRKGNMVWTNKAYLGRTNSKKIFTNEATHLILSQRSDSRLKTRKKKKFTQG